MNKPAHGAPARRRHRREKATIDHLVEQAFDSGGQEKQQRPSTTDNGASIEEEVHKE
jgi:hypothetical protein